MEDRKRKVLFIDNFDSFTYNLVDDFCKRNCQAKVYRADTALDEMKVLAEEFEPDLLVISPGPGTPENSLVLCLPLWCQDCQEIQGCDCPLQQQTPHHPGRILADRAYAAYDNHRLLVPGPKSWR